MHTPGVIGRCAAALCFIGLTSCTAPAADPPRAATAAAAPVTWATLGSWKGTGITQTERFTTTRGEWRVHWTTTNEAMPGASIFQIMVHDADTNALVTLAANQQGPGQNTSYVRAPAGSYYLTINSGNIDWAVEAEEGR